MAAVADAIRIAALRTAVFGVCLAAARLPSEAQTHITLAQLGFRTGPNYSAVYAGQTVMVRGVVSAPAFHFVGYNLLAIQDGRNGGILRIPLSDTPVRTYRPGDAIEARGTVSVQYGMTVLQPENITIVGHKPPPQ